METRLKNRYLQRMLADEHDACAIVASIRSSGEATHGNLKRTIEALGQMGHRSGDVQSEGDGCGVLTDIPRLIWATALEEAGRPSWLADDKRFFVGHLMIPNTQTMQAQRWRDTTLKLIADSGADLLLERPGSTRRQALGRLALAQEPYFWQIAGVMSRCALDAVESNLFSLALAIEAQTPIHVASLSSHSVVYKVRGSVETLYHYYPELRSRDYTSAMTIGHARYSTNTTTIFERVQPFTLLGHNGEINTISRLREQAEMLGTQLVRDGSDSQDVNRIMESLIHRYGFTLIEVMELIFPPILTEVEALPADLRALYRYYRRAFGPFSQGPAAIVARYGDTCIGSVDALGLRPLWYGETEKECFFSSEKGVVPMDLLNGDPKPLAPGEKIAVNVQRNTGAEVLDYPAIQRQALDLATKRFGSVEPLRLATSQPVAEKDGDTSPTDDLSAAVPAAYLAAFGWNRDDKAWAEALADQGRDPIASLGYDGPLASMNDEMHNLSDYFKEKVAVVTNPAVDREREQEHFSTQAIIGPRPPLVPDEQDMPSCVVAKSPVLAGGHTGGPLLPPDVYRKVAAEHGVLHLDDVIAAFSAECVAHLPLATAAGETVHDAVNRLAEEVVSAVQSGAALVVLDDAPAYEESSGWINPHLAVAKIDKALRSAAVSPDRAQDCALTCRRAAGIVVRSGAVRNLHDLILLLGLGADAVAPAALLEVAVGTETVSDPVSEIARRVERLGKTLHALNVGLEKVTSTMGIHELRGYGRIFASIGLSTALVEVMETPNYGGSAERGLTWADLDKDVEARRQILHADKVALKPVPHFLPPIGKPLRQLAQGEIDSATAFAALRAQEKKRPVALRHAIGFNAPVSDAARRIKPQDVDAGITGHNLPFVIASMSFGSQSESAFRTYAEVAGRLNIIALNGEGGEIEDMMGKYPHNRGQQIASARFGVNVDLLNASNLLEIKIGQGAKPGEGGHLPGRKVSAQVARATSRRASI